MSGISFKALSEEGISAMTEGGLAVMRTSIFASQVFSIFLPAVLYGWYTQRNNFAGYFQINKPPIIIIAGLSILFLFISMPLVSYSYQLNSMIPLPSWMVSMEESTAEIMKKLISMNDLFDLIVNLGLISLLAGVGEELLFRGIIQKELFRWFRKPDIAILITAIIFSGFHLQFEGFLPRMVLGLVLGYAYFLSKNLWIPIIMHVVNNATPIISLYFFGDDLNTLDPENAPKVTLWVAILSTAGLIIIAKLISYIQKRNESD